VKIVLGVARGLAFIHHRCRPHQKLAHGNIKSTNVLLDKEGNACISDFGLLVMAHPSIILAKRSVGYKAPEAGEGKKASPKGDVYSFGVLLLEILTGKPPLHSLYARDEGVDLPRWVQSVVQEEWTAEVFDLELLRYKNIEEEMVGMLQIAMQCVSSPPKQRPRMSHVVKMVEDIIGGSQMQSPFRRDDSFDSVSMSPSISEDTGTSH
jgi:serine/threonine protein kinase